MKHVLWLLALTAALTASHSADGEAQGCQRDGALDESDVLRLVQGGVQESFIQNAIESCGTTFVLDDAGMRRFRTAGVPARLLVSLAPPPTDAPGTSWRSPIDQRHMVWIPPGEFQMGSAPGEQGRNVDEEQHVVRHARGFWIDASEVTNRAFQRFLLANPSWQKNQIARRLHDGNYLQDWRGTEFPAGRGDYPVVWISWYAAEAYARWAGKRLPTEAEWEYAARAGTATPYWWGTAFDQSRVAPLIPSGDAALTTFRTRWGVVGMLGGVWEWTSTLYAPYPYRQSDGREDSQRDGRRVKRGGSWNAGPRFLRAASRSSEQPELTSDVLGFRCVR